MEDCYFRLKVFRQNHFGKLDENGWHFTQRVLQINFGRERRAIWNTNNKRKQDSAPGDTSKTYREYLQLMARNATLTILKRPLQSPNLNSTEVLWDQLNREVRQFVPTFANAGIQGGSNCKQAAET